MVIREKKIDRLCLECNIQFKRQPDAGSVIVVVTQPIPRSVVSIGELKAKTLSKVIEDRKV